MHVSALNALKSTKVKFRFNFCCSGYCSLERNKSSNLIGSKFSQFDVVSHIEESQLEGILPACKFSVNLGDKLDHSLKHDGVVAAS